MLIKIQDKISLMHLWKFYIAVTLLIITTFPLIAIAQTNVGQQITQSDTLKLSGSPYVFNGTTLVYPGVHLHVEAGVEMKFTGSSSLRVRGKLTIVGDTDKPVKIRGVDEDEVWGGIFLDRSEESIITFAEISNANTCLLITDDLNPTYPIIKNNLITNCYTGIRVLGNRDGRVHISNNFLFFNIFGITTYMAEPIIESNIIAYSQNEAIYTEANTCGGGNLCNNSSPSILNNSLVYNYGPNVITALSTAPIISNNTIFGNNGIPININRFSPKINGNNIYSDSSEIFVKNGLSNVDSKHNWWDTTNRQVIIDRIFDIFDDFNLGTVDFEPYLTSPNTTAPAIPMQNLSVASQGIDYIELRWSKSQMTDIESYQIFYDTDSEIFSDYKFSTDRLTDTTVIISPLQQNEVYYISGITIDSEGNRSWYSKNIEFKLESSLSTITLSYPENESQNINSTPTLKWNTEPNSSSYTVQLSNDEFSTIIIDEVVTDTTFTTPELSYSTKYSWKVRGSNSSGDGDWSPVWTFTTILDTSIESDERRSEFSLQQNYPNPFNPTTQIRFALPESQVVSISVYDINGRKISNLIDNARYSAGHHQVTFDGAGLSSGIYIYRLMTGDGLSITRKLLLVK